MLIERAVLEKIIAGEIDRAFRRWKRATVKSGGRLRTAAGELAIDDIATVSLDSLTSEDAHRAGYDNLESLKSELARHPDRDLFRISLRYEGPDRREMLRDDDDISDAECADILERIERIGAKTPAEGLSLKILAWIEEWPERRARDLADEVGMEKPKLKSHVRKLKELGLTESRRIGYRLSARGQTLLVHAKKRGSV